MSVDDATVPGVRRGSRNGRRSLLYALAALATALTAYATAWRGGVWLLPVGVVLITLALRHRSSAEPRTGALSAALVVVAVLAGAGALITSGGLQPALRTTSASYSPGDPVTMELRSGWQSVGYNLCHGFVQLEGRDGSQWQRVPASLAPPERDPHVCISLGYQLRLFMGDDGLVHLPTDLAPGEYRLVHDVSVGDSTRRAETQPFTVE